MTYCATRVARQSKQHSTLRCVDKAPDFTFKPNCLPSPWPLHGFMLCLLSTARSHPDYCSSDCRQCTTCAAPACHSRYACTAAIVKFAASSASRDTHLSVCCRSYQCRGCILVCHAAAAHDHSSAAAPLQASRSSGRNARERVVAFLDKDELATVQPSSVC
jgi:hypothetical protein